MKTLFSVQGAKLMLVLQEISIIYAIFDPNKKVDVPRFVCVV